MAKRNTKVPPHYPIAPRYEGEPPIYGTVVPGEPPGPVLDAVLHWRGQGLLIRCEPTDEPLSFANIQREAADLLVDHAVRVERFVQGRRKKIVPAIEAQQGKSRALRERIARALRHGGEIKQVAAALGCHRNTVGKVKRSMK